MYPRILALSTSVLTLASCATYAPTQDLAASPIPDLAPTSLTESLFKSETSTISEADIQRILNGTVDIVENPRIAVLNLDSYRGGGAYGYSNSYFSSFYVRELKADYIRAFSDSLAGRAGKVTLMPQLLVPSQPNVSTLRESAVRMQADLMLVFTVASDIYTEFKFFKNNDLKAYATAEALLLDTRTGIIVFAETVSTEAAGKKQDSDTGSQDVQRRIQGEASRQAVDRLAQRMSDFLAEARG